MLNKLRDDAHAAMIRNGFWGPEKQCLLGYLAALALIHSEVSEVIECVRKNPDALSTKVPQITCEAEECADILLRLLDYCGARGIDLEKAMALKHEYNKTRPFRHGKQA